VLRAIHGATLPSCGDAGGVAAPSLVAAAATLDPRWPGSDCVRCGHHSCGAAVGIPGFLEHAHANASVGIDAALKEMSRTEVYRGDLVIGYRGWRCSRFSWSRRKDG
jgi:hypothetical protein